MNLMKSVLSVRRNSNLLRLKHFMTEKLSKPLKLLRQTTLHSFLQKKRSLTTYNVAIDIKSCGSDQQDLFITRKFVHDNFLRSGRHPYTGNKTFSGGTAT
jgi:hypothetical protein